MSQMKVKLGVGNIICRCHTSGQPAPVLHVSLQDQYNYVPDATTQLVGRTV